jgi:hypothetical protein
MPRLPPPRFPQGMSPACFPTDRDTVPLPMNDFTDDTAVKIYLNRHSGTASDESATTEEGDTTTNTKSAQAETGGLRLRPHNLNTAGVTVPSECFSSPTFRFAHQLLIYPDDLPDDMVFEPLTEAIVFKNTIHDRPCPRTTHPRPPLPTSPRLCHTWAPMPPPRFPRGT